MNYNSIAMLYRMGKISDDGLRIAYERKWITEEEYTLILNSKNK